MMMTRGQSGDMMTIEDAAKELGVTTSTLRRLGRDIPIRGGKIRESYVQYLKAKMMDTGRY